MPIRILFTKKQKRGENSRAFLQAAEVGVSLEHTLLTPSASLLTFDPKK